MVLTSTIINNTAAPIVLSCMGGITLKESGAANSADRTTINGTWGAWIACNYRGIKARRMLNAFKALCTDPGAPGAPTLKVTETNGPT